MKKRYTFTIEGKIIEDVKEFLQEYGGNLSGLIENLLKKWLEEKEKEKKILDLWGLI